MEEWTNRMERENFFNEPEVVVEDTNYYSVFHLVKSMIDQLWTGTAYNQNYKITLTQLVIDHPNNLGKVSSLAEYLIINPLTFNQFCIVTDQSSMGVSLLEADPVLVQIDKYLSAMYTVALVH